MIPAANPASAGEEADITAARQFTRVALPVTATTALTDLVFWDGRPGLSVGIFFAGIGLLLFLKHRGRRGTGLGLIGVLLAATCVQCAVELSFSTALVALTLTLALAGTVFQPQLRGLWPRFSEALYGVVTAPRYWSPVSSLAARGAGTIRAGATHWGGSAAFALQALLPAFVLLIIFGAIFAAGNAVFGEILHRANNAAFNLWENLDVTPLRILWWAVIATLALGLFHGTPAPEQPRWWTRVIPRLTRKNARLGAWQMAAALMAMNALFCVVNTLDAIFVWGHATLPAGIGYSDFVHSGVNSLIMAVLLSAVVIAGMFQQADATADKTWLRRLAHLWVLQNFILIGGVLRRLMLYTEAYHLTEKRIYVGCFLALVATGFVLLAWFAQKRKSFNWLLGSNALATFGLFFILQFVDVAGWVARHNVARWEQGQRIDLEYIASLGPSAWPELIRITKGRDSFTKDYALSLLRNIASQGQGTDWRAFQLRETQARREVTAYLASL